MPSPSYALTELHYREAKKRITAKFTGESDRQKYSYEFHPYFTFKAQSIDEAKKLSALISDFSICVIQEGLALKVFCENFRELKIAYSFLCNATEIRPILIESERQFLLQKGWSYFDGFSIDGEPKKLNTLAPCKCTDFGRQVALANILSIMPEDAERLTDNDAANIFLENVFFSSYEPLKTLNNFSYQNYCPKFDARAFALAIVKNNIGFETLTHNSCAQLPNKNQKILGSSSVRVKFTQNAFFFNSALPCYANSFHRMHANKRSREIRMHEFSLGSYPIGPFFRGQTEIIPLIDAIRLMREKSAFIIKPETISYASSEKRSALAAALLDILSKIHYSESVLHKLERTAFAQKGLAAFLDDGFESTNVMEYLNTADKLLISVIYRLLNENSAFFRYDVAAAIYASAKTGSEFNIPLLHSLPKFSCEPLKI